MGSKGSKPRKPQHSQHLPKVGTATENQRLQHEERQAVLGQFGMRNASSGAKVAVSVVLVLLIIGAIMGLLLLTIWR